MKDLEVFNKKPQIYISKQKHTHTQNIPKRLIETRKKKAE